MSFSDQCARLLALVDCGIPVVAAAEAVGVSRGQAYRLLRAAGRGRGRPRTAMTGLLCAQVVEEFTRTGSINRAAITSGLSHDAARRILVGGRDCAQQTTRSREA